MTHWHGRMVPQEQWGPPKKVVDCQELCRPEYHAMPAHEYLDSPEVLNAKVALLAQLLRQAHHCVAYTGAGLSVSSGLADYATKAKESVDARQVVESRLLAQPNTGHRVLAQLHQGGYVKRCFNQNHDGLLQKAGLPQSAVNEIHGAFFDPANPGGFELRQDLVDDMFEWTAKTDLCLALGTSLSGLNADRMARTPARNYPKKGFGLVIVALQQTQLDDLATLRIFAPLDGVMLRLAEELSLPDMMTPRLTCETEVPDVFTALPFDASGAFDALASSTLDLRAGKALKVTQGNFAGCRGVVAGKNAEGHYLLKVSMPVGEGLCIEEDLVLASWWVMEGRGGKIPLLPVIQA
eukprot:NODE_431_length_1702_cov_58.674531_g314_i0.p1 GENE.NODE_431_length_1702_cov_58.674531_g314_i0~~NODE_431_length_1702_cov_58.674531_g314_i0.p1  ORF type:complete len:351 (-),score=68.32 NODE_431_length_1702_cov_58.674531_g314_i0:317-1369(-)